MTVWFERDNSGVQLCPECGCPVQRIKNGDVRDGMRAHYDTVHREKAYA